jgi:lipopolysaccharide transport system ATP-binding protein
MAETVIRVEQIGKLYKLGEIGTGTLSHDLNRWWARVRGKEDPFAKVGQVNDRTASGNNDYVWALKDINFEVRQGEVLGIIGRNGAGKSTLLKILSKVTTASEGRIKVRGRIASLLEVGTGFHPELTGRENIFLNGAILGMTKAEIKSKFDEIVDFAGVDRYIDTPVKRYSSGMYVRLAFAVAAFLEPEILIVDEVLAVGDAEFQKKCLGRMKDVSENDGRTVLFVSHNMAALSELCGRGVLLNNGRLTFNGDVGEAIRRYIETREISHSGKVIFDGTESERFGEKRYARWNYVELADGQGQPTGHFVMGEPLTIYLALDVMRPSDDFEIGIAIGNFQGVFLHYLLSTWEGFSSLAAGETLLKINVPQINLFPGSYSINIWIAVKGAYYDDAVHGAISFTVEEGKVNEHDTYFQRFSKNTQVYTPSHWSVIQQ